MTQSSLGTALVTGASFENPHGEVAILAGTRAESLGTTAFHCGRRNTSVTDAALATARGVPYADLSKEPPEIRARFCELPAKLNLFRMLANSEGTFLPLISMVSAVFAKLELEPRHREIAILLTGRRTDARYMWEQHLRIAPEAGVTPQQIEAIQNERIYDLAVFDDSEQLILRMADELLRTTEVSELTLDRARAEFSPAQIVETIVLVGFYRMLAGIMRSTELDLDVPASGSWTQHMAA